MSQYILAEPKKPIDVFHTGVHWRGLSIQTAGREVFGL